MKPLSDFVGRDRTLQLSRLQPAYLPVRDLGARAS